MKIKVISFDGIVTFAFQIDKGGRSYGCIFEKIKNKCKLMVHDCQHYQQEFRLFGDVSPPDDNKELARQVIQFAYNNIT